MRPLLIDDPAHPNDRAARMRRLIYAMVAGYLGIVLIAGILNIHLFEMAAPVDMALPVDSTATALLAAHPSRFLDTHLTGMILAAGADRISEIVKSFGTGIDAARKSEEKPLAITGKLILERATPQADDPFSDIRA